MFCLSDLMKTDVCCLSVRSDEDCHVCCLSDLMKIDLLSVRPDELKCYLSDPMNT